LPRRPASERWVGSMHWLWRAESHRLPGHGRTEARRGRERRRQSNKAETRSIGVGVHAGLARGIDPDESLSGFPSGMGMAAAVVRLGFHRRGNVIANFFDA